LIQNIVSDGPRGTDKDLYMTYAFEWLRPQVEAGSQKEKELQEQYQKMAMMAVNSSIVSIRRLVKIHDLWDIEAIIIGGSTSVWDLVVLAHGTWRIATARFDYPSRVLQKPTVPPRNDIESLLLSLFFHFSCYSLVFDNWRVIEGALGRQQIYNMSRFMDSISRVLRPTPETSSTSIIVITVLTTFAAITVSRFAFQTEKIKIIKSPTATLLPRLSQVEKDALPYPPDALPGGRDVDSPVRIDFKQIGCF
jgi:hypothetical protein